MPNPFQGDDLMKLRTVVYDGKWSREEERSWRMVVCEEIWGPFSTHQSSMEFVCKENHCLFGVGSIFE